MKRILSVAALALSLAGCAAFAQMSAPVSNDAPTVQQQGPNRPNPHKAAVRIGKELGLSDDQTAKLEPILADRQQKVQALRANTSLTDAQRKQGMKTIQQTARMQLSQVLSPDQMKQLHKMRQQEKQGNGPLGA